MNLEVDEANWCITTRHHHRVSEFQFFTFPHTYRRGTHHSLKRMMKTGAEVKAAVAHIS